MIQETNRPVVKASDVKLFIDKCRLSNVQKDVLRARLKGLCPNPDEELTAPQLDIIFEGLQDLRQYFVPQ